MRKDKHRPPHIYIDDTIYFITAGTVNKAKYFDNDKKKGILLDVINKACRKFLLDLIAWTILDNHYHILTGIDIGEKVPKFVNNLNANSSRLLNQHDKCQGRKVWHQYFDRCIRQEEDYWTRFNYIHHNCVKHGYSDNMRDYKYSSYCQWIEDEGEEWMNNVLETYPVLDFTPEGEVE